MNLCYLALVNCDEKGVAEVKIAELGIELKGEDVSGLGVDELKKMLETQVEKRTTEIQLSKKKMPEPKKIETVVEEQAFDYVIPITVDVMEKRGFFSTLFPYLGGVSCVVSAVSGTIISVVALQLAMEDRAGTWIWSVLQACIANGLGMIMYFYSQSGAGLARLGAKVDGLFDKKIIPDEKSIPVSCATSTKLIAMKICLGSAVIINSVSNTLTGAQELSALGQQSHDKGSLIPDEIFDLSKYVFLASAGISGLSFVSSFVGQMYADFEKRQLTPATLSEESETLSDSKEIMSGENKHSEGMSIV